MSATTVPPTSAAPSNWNIANGLTALRIALVPLFAALLLHHDGRQTEWRVAAAVAFAGAVATDRIDGELARSRGLVTNLGKIADPIADKALIGAALISLSMLDELWWTVTVLILARELGITLLRFIVIRHGVMPAGRGGKAKTVAQSLAIMLYIAPLPDPVQPVAKVAMGIALALTLATGLDYMIQAYRMREGSERTRLKRARRRLRRCAPGAPGAAVTEGTGSIAAEPGVSEASVTAERPVSPSAERPGVTERPVSAERSGSAEPSAGEDPPSGKDQSAGRDTVR